jgi:hypothetical protein
MTHSISIPPGSVHVDDDAWEFVSMTEDFITHRAVRERFADGNVSYVYKREARGLLTLLEANKASLDDSETAKTRFAGDEHVLGTKISSIPLNEFFAAGNQIAEKIREGDRDHLRWFLNRDTSRPWKTFRGTV